MNKLIFSTHNFYSSVHRPAVATLAELINFKQGKDKKRRQKENTIANLYKQRGYRVCIVLEQAAITHSLDAV